MINRRSERALYRQLADILRDKISSGEYAPGDTLPTADLLARTYDVGHGVAHDALTLLKREGLVETSKGKHPWVSKRKPRTVVKVQRGSAVVVREASAAEREQVGIREGELLVVVTFGGRAALYGSDAVELRFS